MNRIVFLKYQFDHAVLLAKFLSRLTVAYRVKVRFHKNWAPTTLFEHHLLVLSSFTLYQKYSLPLSFFPSHFSSFILFSWAVQILKQPCSVPSSLELSMTSLYRRNVSFQCVPITVLITFNPFKFVFFTL